MPQLYNLEIYQGATFTARFTGLDEDGVALNLSGCAISGHLRYKYSDDSPLLNLDVSIHSSLVSGLVDLTIPAEDTRLLPITKAVYDIEMFSSGDSSTERIVMGLASIFPEATH